MITQKQFESIVLSEAKFEGRQSIASGVGKRIQTEAARILSELPYVAKVEQEIFEESVDEFSNIDIVVTLTNGKVVYVPVAKDLWIGTSQIDRLQNVWTKFKFGAFRDINYIYLYFDEHSFQEKMDYEPKRKNVRKNIKVQNVLSTLKTCQVIGNIEDVIGKLADMS